MSFFGLDLLGIAGAFLVVIAWVFEVQQIVKQHHSPMAWNFGALYLAGAVMLTVYAFASNSPIFAVLNLLAALLALAGLYYKRVEHARVERKLRSPQKKRRRARK